MSRRLEIYGTLGPACKEEETLRAMFAAGITGMRLNLSHVSLAQSGEILEAFHAAAAKEQVQEDLLIDMQGPELRIGALAEGIPLEKDALVTLYAEGEYAHQGRAIPVPSTLLRKLGPGQKLKLDDGKILLEITEVISESDSVQMGAVSSQNGQVALARVLVGGILLSRKSIAVEGMNLGGPTLTAHDLENLRQARACGVTGVMQPFVRGAKDLIEVREAMRSCGAGECRLFAKIENQAGISSLEELLPLSDMIVIARGDLGNAVPLWRLPRLQKEIAERCLEKEVPFMVVTQMLASMVQNPMPTRAEVSDIFHAVADGASAVMITGESAAGEYPVEAARYLVRTATDALEWESLENPPRRPRG